jgi:putative transposase
MYGQIDSLCHALPLTQMCQVLSVSRRGYYRWKERDVLDRDMDLRDMIQKIALVYPFYGYRRITRELARSYGIRVNHKKVLRLMREDNLLCLRRKGFLRTTDSTHALDVYPNLTRGLIPARINQLWVADITYIRLVREFVYLAVVLDAYSRRCIGWELDRHLHMTLTYSALSKALMQRKASPGLIHHSDRGIQYAAREYTDLLKKHGISISMARKGNPYDNAMAESFMKTLKYEEVYLFDYTTLSEARGRIDHFIGEVYNEKRLHSSLGYLPPAEFEEGLCGPMLT